ncbi:1,4-alpha-glucan branching protein GlgB [Shewanella sp. AS16]|uniref:1,4-alpha-glucan branching protein GlgB n=1 Tax=Shewanella sp. AS16 TaxID=2907625 RepID=UPI001F4099DF|nr:1,4-alpha-glucan branching protein GlgB [Shewanella sp. AS16]MCE9685205.1 1,4-alpha-glucan branching protein GlgB [Shewanella sp. AS16]
MTHNAPYFHDGADIALLNGDYIDVFSLLGMHSINQGKALSVRCFLRGAMSVDVVGLKDNRKVASLEKLNDEGLFAGSLGRRVKPFLYKLRVEYPLCRQEIIDPYQFASLLNADDLFLFGEGSAERAYEFLGANWRTHQGVTGVHFCVWAPNARRVSLVGDFNHWDSASHVMRQHLANGLWEIFLPGVEAGAHYKFEIQRQSGECQTKADPYAKVMECPPHNASLVPPEASHEWQDAAWLERRADTHWHQAPMSIYEVHLGSWRRKGEDGQAYLDYQDLVRELIPYVQQQGFTHIELMPISEYPFDGSWGYQPVGLFAPSHRFGDAKGLKAFVDACHGAGIAVLLDWVVAHFPKDSHGLARFDGTCLYEHEDPRQGTHPDWDTLIYNYGRGEVQSLLLSNACYWLREFHFDGLRLDAVSSMLYLDYSREADQWLPNAEGGRENLEAIAFLQNLNRRLYQAFPGICMIAEESTAWPGVTQATEHKGLGFGFKWNMGWMNDSLSYLGRDPLYRSHHHNQLTFSLMYAHTEQFILSLSHDEVVHGKGSLLHKIPGDDWQKFATLRAYYGFMWGHPGKKLLFMGNEFAQRDEWRHGRSLDWHLLEYAPHQGVQAWVRDLNALYRQQRVLAATDHVPGGFVWLDCDNSQSSVFAFMRRGGPEDASLIFVVNMTPQLHQGFRLGLPLAGKYRECLNSDSHCYGGSNQGNAGLVVAEPEPWQGQACSALITVPPLACIVLTPVIAGATPGGVACAADTEA